MIWIGYRRGRKQDSELEESSEGGTAGETGRLEMALSMLDIRLGGEGAAEWDIAARAARGTAGLWFRPGGGNTPRLYALSKDGDLISAKVEENGLEGAALAGAMEKGIGAPLFSYCGNRLWLAGVVSGEARLFEWTDGEPGGRLRSVSSRVAEVLALGVDGDRVSLAVSRKGRSVLLEFGADDSASPPRETGLPRELDGGMVWIGSSRGERAAAGCPRGDSERLWVFTAGPESGAKWKTLAKIPVKGTPLGFHAERKRLCFLETGGEGGAVVTHVFPRGDDGKLAGHYVSSKLPPQGMSADSARFADGWLTVCGTSGVGGQPMLCSARV